MPKPVLISGIQPSGRLHIGNYLGALENFVSLQNSGKYNCLFFIADLHALTENPNPKELKENTEDLIISFLAAGINPERIFIQSKIPEHLELFWILSTLVGAGSDLLGMTQFKNKALQMRDISEKSYITAEISKNIFQVVNVGLLTYPILMTSDIALYNASLVPVGDDQLQHLEFARAQVRKFNSRFGQVFIEPQPKLTETSRVMSLDDPTKKMSKSRPRGCIFIDDSPREIMEKIKHAVTDSVNEVKYRPGQQPGISNLMLIYSAMSDLSLQGVKDKFVGKRYSEFKLSLAEAIIDFLKPFQEKKKRLLVQKSKNLKKIEKGNRVAKKLAEKKMSEVKKAIGLPVI